MVELRILSGRRSSEVIQLATFPFRIGRASDSELLLKEPGVWDQHCRIEADESPGFRIIAEGDAIVSFEGVPIRQRRLRNGESFECGGIRFRFLVAAVGRRPGQLSAILTWSLLAVVLVIELGLLWWFR
ncbi:MAG: FHA domain-containing protein [Pedosphaera sp.]|nr:FHA domain-containing protein [Pedosphaera sp.]